MAYSSTGVNLTLDAFQKALVASLREMASPDTAGLGGATLQYVAGKGDWKWKTSWLREKRDYCNLRELPLRGPSFCRRCSCASIPDDRHWLDFQNLSFSEPELVAATLDDNVPLDLPLHALRFMRGIFCCVCVLHEGNNLGNTVLHVLMYGRLRQLEGWTMAMEAPDLLHNVWLGAAKDSIASVLLDIVTYDERFAAAGSYDVALAMVTTLVHEFCEEHGLDKSTVEELSTLRHPVNNELLVQYMCVILSF